MWDEIKQEFSESLNKFDFTVIDEQDGAYAVEYLAYNDTLKVRIEYQSACAAYFITMEIVPYKEVIMNKLPVTNSMNIAQLVAWLSNITVKLDY